MAELITIVKVRGAGAGRIRQQVYKHLFESTNAKFAKLGRRSPFADFMPEEDVQVIDNPIEVPELPREENPQPEPKVTAPVVNPDYDSLTRDELKDLAEDLKGYRSNLSTKKLIELLKNKK